MGKISLRRGMVRAAKKAAHPRTLLRALRLAKSGSARSSHSTELDVYSRVLPGEFLHYGYFDDPGVRPETLSLRDIEIAQLRYAELLLDQISDREAPVLDVGCGMGGLLKLMIERGLEPFALTPDSRQARYVAERYPSVPLFETRFEDLAERGHRDLFGTLVTSESVQYLDLAAALPLVEHVLKPGGRWIACDYFRLGPTEERRSGHVWAEFLERLNATSLRIVNERDLTEHVLPTLAFVDMWGKRLGLPVLSFSLEKLRTKRPATHFLFEDLLTDVRDYVGEQLAIVDPEIFRREKRYMLLVLENGDR